MEEDYPDDEDIIVQGIIDAFFYEGDDIVIMDYKTDRVRSGERLSALYETQLRWYARALEMMKHKPVTERWLWSFTLGKAVSL